MDSGAESEENPGVSADLTDYVTKQLAGQDERIKDTLSSPEKMIQTTATLMAVSPSETGKLYPQTPSKMDQQRLVTTEILAGTLTTVLADRDTAEALLLRTQLEQSIIEQMNRRDMENTTKLSEKFDGVTNRLSLLESSIANTIAEQINKSMEGINNNNNNTNQNAFPAEVHVPHKPQEPPTSQDVRDQPSIHDESTQWKDPSGSTRKWNWTSNHHKYSPTTSPRALMDTHSYTAHQSHTRALGITAGPGLW